MITAPSVHEQVALRLAGLEQRYTPVRRSLVAEAELPVEESDFVAMQLRPFAGNGVMISLETPIQLELSQRVVVDSGRWLQLGSGDRIRYKGRPWAQFGRS